MSNTLPEINVEQVKSYNNTLKEYTEKGAALRAELTYVTNELNKLCEELSAELNVQVTVDNIEQIYMERVSKVENTLRTGEEILQRIKEEEARYSGVQQGTIPAQNIVQPMQTQPVDQPVDQHQVATGTPQFSELDQPTQQPAIPGLPNGFFKGIPTGAPSVAPNSGQTGTPNGAGPGNQQQLGTLPGMFSNTIQI